MIEDSIDKILKEYFQGAMVLEIIEKVKGEMENVKNCNASGEFDNDRSNTWDSYRYRNEKADEVVYS